MYQQIPFSEHLDAEKYREAGESFRESRNRVANGLKDDDVHFRLLQDVLTCGRFWPGGRILAAIGSLKRVTPYNCYLSGQIYDTFTESGGIMERATEGATTMRMGGGIGYDFTPLRPRGDLIKSLLSRASGPVSFMKIYDAVCNATRSSGHRRGAQMGVLGVWHPDIVEYIHAKQNEDTLTAFNLSVACSDPFMYAVMNDKEFDLTFGGRVYSTVRAVNLWDMIMRCNYDWAEPGVLFIDRINFMNNLWYCEKIFATNPCGEQPLPPYGACLLGSFNLTMYLRRQGDKWVFDIEQFKADIPVIIRAMDNVVDRALYPLPEQEAEARSKRRMGIGIMGAANTVEALLGKACYGSEEFLSVLGDLLTVLRDESYRASVQLAKEKGPFPLFDTNLYLQGQFIKTLPVDIQEDIQQFGIRNSHLLSTAPTGTISLAANNVSSGIEPVVDYEYSRTVQTFDGPTVMKVRDFGLDTFGIRGKLSRECTVDEHINTLLLTQKYMDSAVSKTTNLPKDIPWEDFKAVYLKAYEGGAKGCAIYRYGCKREGIMHTADDESCYIDPLTGRKECT